MNNEDKALFFYNAGTLAKKEGKLKKAVKKFLKAIEILPTLTPAYNNLALCYKDQGDFAKALQTLEKAVAIDPVNHMLLANLANIYRDTGNLEDAIKNYSKSLDAKMVAETACDLGYTYLMQKDLENAKIWFAKAVKEDPKSSKAHYGLGHTYNYLGDIQKAKDAYEECYELNKNYEQTAASLFVAKRKLCDWEDIKDVEKILEKTCNETPWGSLMRTEDESSNLIAGRLRSLRYEAGARGQQYKHTVTENDRKKKKIRIGYVSGNFGNHPVSYTMASVFEYHDKNKFEVFAYSYGRDDGSQIRKAVIKNTDKFTDISGLGSKAAAAKIFGDNIDILVDLTGYTEGTRSDIFAYRPSPIQITWAGLSASTGASFFDYMIADPVVVPKANRKHYTEKLALVSPCFCPCKLIPPPSETKIKRSDFGLPDKGIVLASFNQMYKIEPVTWAYWMKILKEVPGSVLWVLEQSSEGAKNLLKQAETQGVEKKRIIFAKQMSFGLFYSRMALADIALDTRVYGGGTTSYFALARGVPIVTLKGGHPASLFTTSILESAGLTELSANTMEEYEKIVVNLATNKNKLKEIKSKIASDKVRETIFNVAGKTKELENVFVKIRKNYLSGKPPAEVRA